MQNNLCCALKQWPYFYSKLVQKKNYAFSTTITFLFYQKSRYILAATRERRYYLIVQLLSTLQFMLFKLNVLISKRCKTVFKEPIEA